jgi:hypothetical protein
VHYNDGLMKETRRHALQNQIRRLQGRLVRLQHTSHRYAWIRLAIFVAGILASGAAFFLAGPWQGGLCLVVLGLLFGSAVYYHRQIEDSIVRHQVWLRIKAAQVARMDLDWEHIPTRYGYRPRREHPFEADLELVGERSLHQLLDTAVSYEGSQRLRAWLTAPVPELEGIARRQQLVRELVPLSLLRDKLILNTTVVPGSAKSWDARQLTAWLEGHAPEGSLRRWLALGGALAALNIVLFGAHRLGLVPPLWRVSFVVYLGLIFAGARNAGAMFEEAMTLGDALGQLGAAFRLLERYSYRNTPHLKALCAPFRDERHRPSQYLKRSARIVAAVGVRGNPIAWFALNAVVPWDFIIAERLNRHKSDLARYAPAWMEVWFELEALSSLANLAYLNPGYAFPGLLAEGEQEPPFVFQARELGHPLIPDDERVCNDFSVDELGQITVITGSNMAGKSVFLKTVGANLALAYAGGPVNARSLRTVLFRLFTSIQVTDSLTDGISYFYAEVKRLKGLLTELEGEHPVPLFFFIDEILRGTNNRERLLGSRAYLRTLVEKRGVGLIATHDLELAGLADENPHIRNYHFRDAITDGRMVFDYRLHPGPCPTTNALRIMAMEGLPVPRETGIDVGHELHEWGHESNE